MTCLFGTLTPHQSNAAPNGNRSSAGSLGCVLCIAALVLASGLIIAAVWRLVAESVAEQKRAIVQAEAALQEAGGYAGVTNRRGYYYVVLAETGVDDAKLAELAPHLAALPHLIDINLFGTDITDEGLKHLKNLQFLQRLELAETEVTENGARALQKAIPECNISYSGRAARDP